MINSLSGKRKQDTHRATLSILSRQFGTNMLSIVMLSRHYVTEREVQIVSGANGPARPYIAEFRFSAACFVCLVSLDL